MSALHFPFGERLPETGTVLEVAPGVRWVRMPLPFALDHINLWLLRDRLDGREGWAIVDCGVATDATRAAWEAIFASALDGLPVLRVIVTHLHPDHVGLADWLTRRWSEDGRECELWMSATDWFGARLYSAAGSGIDSGAAVRLFARHGRTEPALAPDARGRGRYYPTLVPAVPTSVRRLMDGQELDIGGVTWRCIVGYGHAPEHISLHAEASGVMISGDMVLPRISTNVSVTSSEPLANPLRLYLESIARLRVLPPQTLVLPSHGRPFVGLQQRIGELEAHHAARLAEVLAACADAPHTAADLLPVLFRRQLDAQQVNFAMGEAIAHLNYLVARGDLCASTDGDGVIRFRLAR